MSGKRTICFASHIELDEREGGTGGRDRPRAAPSLPIVIEVDVWVEEGERVLAREEGRSRAGIPVVQRAKQNDREGNLFQRHMAITTYR